MRQIAIDVLGVIGFVSLVHGIDLVSRPAAWIVCGVGALAFAVLGSAPAARKGNA